MKDKYIDQYGTDSLPDLIMASITGRDSFITTNKELLKDKNELEAMFKIKIKTSKDYGEIK